MKSESGSGLRKLLETTTENLRALTELNQPTDQWDSILVFWLSDKMDPESRKQWQLDNPGSELLKWEQLANFPDTRSRALECGGASKMAPAEKNAKQGGVRAIQGFQTAVVCSDSCSENHRLHACPQFRKMSVADRFNLVKRRKACLNCLSSDHSASDCPSKFTCKGCKGKHHTLLHKDRQPGPKKECKEEQEEKAADTGSYMTSGHCSGGTPITSVLLATAMVKIRNSAGSEVLIRAVLDSG